MTRGYGHEWQEGLGRDRGERSRVDTLPELLKWLVAVAAGLGQGLSAAADRPAVAVNVPDPGVSTKDFVAPAVALLVGVAAMWNSQRIQKATLSHDRSMRLKDDARDALAQALVVMDEAERAVQAISDAASPLRAFLFQPPRTPVTSREERMSAAGKSADAIGQRGAVLRLYFDSTDPVFASYQTVVSTLRLLTRTSGRFGSMSGSALAHTTFDGPLAGSALRAIRNFRERARDYSLSPPAAPLRLWQLWRKDWWSQCRARWLSSFVKADPDDRAELGNDDATADDKIEAEPRSVEPGSVKADGRT
jgi:hypothetical protein